MLPAELKTLEIDPGGRDRPEFGTVRPRVQIPGPRPISEYKLLQAAIFFGRFDYQRFVAYRGGTFFSSR
jgi:hypothetical protein